MLYDAVCCSMRGATVLRRADRADQNVKRAVQLARRLPAGFSHASSLELQPTLERGAAASQAANFMKIAEKLVVDWWSIGGPLDHQTLKDQVRIMHSHTTRAQAASDPMKAV